MNHRTRPKHLYLSCRECKDAIERVALVVYSLAAVVILFHGPNNYDSRNGRAFSADSRTMRTMNRVVVYMDPNNVRHPVVEVAVVAFCDCDMGFR